ncbi:MAG: filamentous hemagglutinin family outer membrane protein, partial [Gammaproteobacteria bacterium]|nr:filamentous hemagglutinin family outer membrane protein [Gammaproteobacteria bacterium]
ATANLVTVIGVTLSNGINGGLASNYALASAETAVAHISHKELTATVTAQDKVYDGNTTASATLAGLTGLIGTETVGVSGTGSFNSKNVVTANLVTVNSTTLSDGTNGGLASNYRLASGATATAHITPKSVTVVGQTASDKVYDGTTTATLSGGTVSGLVAGETVDLNPAGAFASANVGNAIAVAAADTLAGTAASNYALTQPTGLTANIGPMVKLQSAVSSAVASAQVPPTALSPAGPPSGFTSPTVTADSFSFGSQGGSAGSGGSGASGSSGAPGSSGGPGSSADSGGSGGAGSAGGPVSSEGPVGSSSSTGSIGSPGVTQFEIPGLNLTVTVQDVSLPSTVGSKEARDEKK